jgi:hypothetical protein
MSSFAKDLADALMKASVWAKGHEIPGYDPAIWRHDDFGHVIRFTDYGDRTSPYGWEKDHIQPVALLGHSGLANMRPLHHSRNASLGGVLSGLLGKA